LWQLGYRPRRASGGYDWSEVKKIKNVSVGGAPHSIRQIAVMHAAAVANGSVAVGLDMPTQIKGVFTNAKYNMKCRWIFF
jgi:hypothetical protein